MFKIIRIFLISTFILNIANTQAQTKIIPLAQFNKVIVSPHIEVKFVKGNENTITIENILVAEDKLNVEVDGNTLQIYLDDAKTYTKSEKKGNSEYNNKQSIYQGTIVTATITYKTLEELSLRGEEKFECSSLLEVEKFVLTIYGESEVVFTNVNFNTLNTTIYGESILEIQKGNIERHKIISYGESEINSLNTNTKSAKITAYGEGIMQINVIDDLKITAYGEAEILYKGNPTINKGIVIGEATIKKILE